MLWVSWDQGLDLCLASHTGQEGHLFQASHLRNASGSLRCPMDTGFTALLDRKEMHEVCGHDSPRAQPGSKMTKPHRGGPHLSQMDQLTPAPDWVIRPLLNQLLTRGSGITGTSLD